jgi:hypothetical protein
MAYVSKELKAKAAAGLKKALKDVKIKYSLSGKNNSNLRITIQACEIDFISNFNEVLVKDRRVSSWGGEILPRTGDLDVNPHWMDSHFDGKALEILQVIKQELLTDEYYNDSDARSDYFHQSHYIEICIGTYDKPFVVLPA